MFVALQATIRWIIGDALHLVEHITLMPLHPVDIRLDSVDRHAPEAVRKLCIVRVRVDEFYHLQCARDSAVGKVKPYLAVAWC